MVSKKFTRAAITASGFRSIPAKAFKITSRVSASAKPNAWQLAFNARAARIKKVPEPQAGSNRRFPGLGGRLPGIGILNRGSPSWFNNRSASQSGV